MRSTLCNICAAPTAPAGEKRGKLRQRAFHLRQCHQCWFSYVVDSDDDYENIYDWDYYRGKGADPLANYTDEWQHLDTTIRLYEWRGLAAIARGLIPAPQRLDWLDFGCGTGTFVHWLNRHRDVRAYGHDSGIARQLAQQREVQVLDDEALRGSAERFDVVTAIEVLEHLDDPMAVIEQIYGLLKPNGLFLYTTGNARFYRHDLPSWAYLVPEIHISFFEPATMALALQRAGFETRYPDRNAGYRSVIKYKVLKNIRMQRQRAIWELLPWRLLTRLADARAGVSEFPLAIKPAR